MRKRKHWIGKQRNKEKDFIFSSKKEKRAKWIRKMLIKKYGGVCVCCGEVVNLIHDDPKQATIDHITPLSKGGGEDLENLQLMCSECNSKKGDNTY